VPDVLVVSRGSIDSLIKDGKIASGSDATLAKSVFAIAVKHGAPKPDISSPEALKRALLAARAVGYSDPAAGGASGVHFAKVLDRLGIAPEIKFQPSAGFVGTLLVSGAIDIAVLSKPKLSTTENVEIVGPLPGDLGATTLFAAGVGASSSNSETGRALVKFLTSSKAQTAFTAHGFDPP